MKPDNEAHTADNGMENIVSELRKTMRCNCDLDTWEPEPTTGHSWVCRIHEAAIKAAREGE